jgi:hypothetical protein
MVAIEHQANHARRPARGMPLGDDQHEGIAGEERRADLNSPATHQTVLSEARLVGLEAGQRQAMQRQAVPLRRQLGCGPVHENVPHRLRNAERLQ